MIQKPHSGQALLRARKHEAYDRFLEAAKAGAKAILREEKVFRTAKSLLIEWETWLRSERDANVEIADLSRRAQ